MTRSRKRRFIAENAYIAEIVRKHGGEQKFTYLADIYNRIYGLNMGEGYARRHPCLGYHHERLSRIVIATFPNLVDIQLRNLDELHDFVAESCRDVVVFNPKVGMATLCCADADDAVVLKLRFG